MITHEHIRGPNDILFLYHYFLAGISKALNYQRLQQISKDTFWMQNYVISIRATSCNIVLTISSKPNPNKKHAKIVFYIKDGEIHARRRWK